MKPVGCHGSGQAAASSRGDHCCLPPGSIMGGIFGIFIGLSIKSSWILNKYALSSSMARHRDELRLNQSLKLDLNSKHNLTTSITGHVHVAKTGGTSLNAMMALVRPLGIFISIFARARAICPTFWVSHIGMLIFIVAWILFRNTLKSADIRDTPLISTLRMKCGRRMAQRKAILGTEVA